MSHSRHRPARSKAAVGRPATIAFDRDECLDLRASLAREWLETDGLGGYASLSSVFCPTRRQHGLLVAPFRGNARRHVFLQRFEEILDVGGREFPLSMARYAGLNHPLGHLTLDRFEAAPWPKSVHRVGEVTVVREVLMPKGSPAVLVRYTVEGTTQPVTLRLRPLLPCRDANALTFENVAANVRTDDMPAGLRWRPYVELPPVSTTVAGARWRYLRAPTWYRGIEYSTDLARGYDGHEDTFSPGTIVLSFARGGGEAVVATTIEEPVAAPAALFRRTATARRAAWFAEGTAEGTAAVDDVHGVLAYGADRFLARAPDGRSAVLAGFPWFTEWARDTFLAVPGLFFARGRVEEGGDVLEGWTRLLRDGRFPNRFEGDGTPRWNSADAPLWFALAVARYERAGGSPDRVVHVFLPALRSIVQMLANANIGDREDADGLPHVGSPKENVTWMDAVVHGEPVTPRWGCPVEIAALWVSARRILAEWETRYGSRTAAADATRRADRSAAAFVARFWLPRRGSLADVWREAAVDATIRPNMVVAAALEGSPLSKEQRQAIVRTADAALVTPRGLRTLSPADPAYAPRYEGDVTSRDRAYHQGTVWPWLVGFHVEATLAAFGRSAAVVRRLRAWLDGFAPATREFGLGHVAEVYDGDPPHRPGGTFAQAWSDAELLRACALLDDAAPRAHARRR